MTPEQAIGLIDLLCAAFPRQRLDEKSIAVHAHMIQDLPFSDAETAARSLIATGTFFPSIAELRKEVAEITANVPDWEDAWATVTKLRSEYGVYIQHSLSGPLPLSDLTHRALNVVGGYQAVCLVDYKDEPTMRAQFRDAYQRFRAKRIEEVATHGLSALTPSTLFSLTEG